MIRWWISRPKVKGLIKKLGSLFKGIKVGTTTRTITITNLGIEIGEKAKT